MDWLMENYYDITKGPNRVLVTSNKQRRQGLSGGVSGETKVVSCRWMGLELAAWAVYIPH